MEVLVASKKSALLLCHRGKTNGGVESSESVTAERRNPNANKM